MKHAKLIMHESCWRQVFGAALPATIAVFMLAASAQATAQTALETASVTVSTNDAVSAPPLRVDKISEDGGFRITVTNAGTNAVEGAVVTDKIGGGLPCPAENPVLITGSGVPDGTFTLAVLISSGIALKTISVGQSVTFTYSCQAS